MPARRPPTSTRRTALGGTLLGLGALAGCDLDPPDGESRGPGARPDEDPDTALVDRALTELDELVGLVAAVGARFPALGEPMAALRELHLAHRTALGEDPPADRTPDGRSGVSPRPAGPAEALGLVRSREQRAQRRLADWSVAAESGALARLLASMSAGVAQRLAVLPARVGEGA